MRIGHGIDVHKFGDKGPLIIGGVHIPFKNGLLAHSDGDVMLHSVIDALLGAGSLGDIGKIFPNCDSTLKGINSRILLCKVWKTIKNKGYILENIDITIIAQVPKLSKYFYQMCIYLSEDIGCSINQINIKSTTTEKLGFIGRNEGIACESVALLREKIDL